MVSWKKSSKMGSTPMGKSKTKKGNKITAAFDKKDKPKSKVKAKASKFASFVGRLKSARKSGLKDKDTSGAEAQRTAFKSKGKKGVARGIKKGAKGRLARRARRSMRRRRA